MKRLMIAFFVCTLIITGCGQRSASAMPEQTATAEVTILRETGEQAEEKTNGRTGGQAEEKTNGRTGEQAEEKTNEQTGDRAEVQTKAQKNEQTTLTPSPDMIQETEEKNVTGQTLTLTIGGQEFTASFEDNETTKAFLSMLPLTLTMSDFNGNEKVTALSESIRKDNSGCPETIYSGDIMCYGSDQLVIFYDTFPTIYSYVKIGHVDDVEGYVEALGSGSAEVTFSMK